MTPPQHPVHYIEIVTPDVEKMCELYSNSFGWIFQPASPQLGNARVTELQDGSLYGIRAPMHATEKALIRLYIRVQDIEAYVQKVTQTGGKILLEPMKIPGYGIIAIYEIGGIEKGLWQVV